MLGCTHPRDEDVIWLSNMKVGSTFNIQSEKTAMLGCIIHQWHKKERGDHSNQQALLEITKHATYALTRLQATWALFLETSNKNKFPIHQ